MIPRRWLTLVKSASVWSDHDNVWFKVIPRYLNDSTRFSGLLLIIVTREVPGGKRILIINIKTQQSAFKNLNIFF
jgi:hypothetical protein